MSYRWGEFVLSHLYVFCFLVLLTALARNLFEIVAKKMQKQKTSILGVFLILGELFRLCVQC